MDADDERSRVVCILELHRANGKGGGEWMVCTIDGDVLRFHDRGQLCGLIKWERWRVVSCAELAAMKRTP